MSGQPSSQAVMSGPAVAAAPPNSIEGAVVFTDIVSFTEFNAVEGDAAANELLSAQELIVNQFLPAGSWLVKELGDGLMLWFPDADAALATCLRLMQRFEEYSLETLQPLWVRMDIHWGRQTRRRADLIGHDVNLAARIANEAGATELLLSEATVAELRDASAAEFEELGPVIMKGIPDPVRLFRATPA
ncbi:MAG: adenylate/guanylate cyclase domain-containing protein [Chloroflexota bacterium]|nr:adenylate/guanylate cyclase domain-containing protein [Chloroflexota bacterium]